ncbi:tyrosine-type recombinase/integrase [Nocardia altamirensis]|uniref:tyrosine-type recombinase/integrase n=1 Tax=Nocardia altamirensis TaxID=472158 RepID=UPI0008405AB8|nr:site-specific integrase [Nocardia altamirensis]
MSSIRPRTCKNGSAYFQVLFRHNGKQTSESFDSEGEAERWKGLLDLLGPNQALAMLYEEQDQDTEDLPPTIHDAFTEVIDGLTGIEPGTRNRFRRILVNDIEPFFGARSPVTVFSETVIGRWINHLAENVGNAAKTIANKHGALFQILKRLARRGVIPSNPCEQTKLPRVVAKEMCHLEPEEFAALLAALPARWRLLVEFLVASGARWGEVTALRVRDINRKALTARIHKAWKYTGGKRKLGPPKTKKSTRTVNLPAQLVAKLPLDGRDLDEWLFCVSSGEPISISHFYKDVWVPTRDALSLVPGNPVNGKAPRIHDLRHTCAAWMLSAGVPIHVVQAHLGHESIKTTVDTYGHLDRRAAADAAAVIGEKLAPQPAPAPLPPELRPLPKELALVVSLPAPVYDTPAFVEAA